METYATYQSATTTSTTGRWLQSPVAAMPAPRPAEARGAAPMTPSGLDLADVADRAMLQEAWERVRTRSGFPGPDGETVPEFARRAGESLAIISRALLEGRYEPGRPDRREVAKPGGGHRLFTVYNVRDRIVLQAIRLAMRPAVERALSPCSFAYRPGLCAADASRRVEKIMLRATWLARADVAGFFDHVRLDLLLPRIAELGTDAGLLNLVRRALDAGALRPGVGLPQGSSLSPMFSNLYLAAVDAEMIAAGARFVRYGDDIIFACRTSSEANAALRRVAEAVGRLGLSLNQSKSGVQPLSDGFCFLGVDYGSSACVSTPPVMPELLPSPEPEPREPEPPRPAPARWTGGVAQLARQCTVLPGIEARAARERNLPHNERVIVLFTAGRLGDEGGRYLHQVMSHCSDYSRSICDRRLAELDREHPPITCGKIREWLAAMGDAGLCACGRTCRTPLDGLLESPRAVGGPPTRTRAAAGEPWRQVSADMFDDE
ncbi:MAG: reverse transcriptase domain-containing protein [Armatimonadetes bacterium]|nr:reverse transcriptase domain-containing protein [Armatimonadota bacterium]